jgi:RNA polymerase sigma-70 factor (ECF subfamily)
MTGFIVDLNSMPASEDHMATWTKLKGGDQAALLELYNVHYLGLMNYGLKLTGNRTLTSSSITQVLLRLWDNRSKLPEVDNVRSYLLTCLRNEMLAELKSESKRVSSNKLLRFSGEASEASYEEYLIAVQSNRELKERLHKALDKLTAREKELLSMKFFEDLSYEEIAQRCRITRRTAYNIIHAAVKTLRVELNQPRNTKVEIDHLLLFLPFLIKNFLVP